MRVAGVRTLDEANRYLETEFLRWVNAPRGVGPATADDADRPLEKRHDLASILSQEQKRPVNNGYTFPLAAKTYRIARTGICTDLRGAYRRSEQRRDGGVAARRGNRYLR